jgi:hypothetical protein
MLVPLTPVTRHNRSANALGLALAHPHSICLCIIALSINRRQTSICSHRQAIAQHPPIVRYGTLTPAF